MLATVLLDKDIADKFIWKPNTSGEFSVKSFYSLLSKFEPQGHHGLLSKVWLGLAPPKIEVFLWLAIQNSIVARGFLYRRHILDAERNICPLCQSFDETSTHILIHCKKVQPIWYQILAWWGTSWCMPPSIPILFTNWCSMAIGLMQSVAWKMLFFAALWSIWLARNKVVFNSSSF